MKDLDRILKECFWDLNYSNEDLKEILSGSDQSMRMMVFGKILENSTNMIKDLQLFSIEEIAHLLNLYKVSQFNAEYFSRRKNIAEVFFLEKPLEINELKWAT